MYKKKIFLFSKAIRPYRLHLLNPIITGHKIYQAVRWTAANTSVDVTENDNVTECRVN